MATTAVQPVKSSPLAPITDALSVQMPHIAKLLPADIALEQFRAATWMEMRQQRGLAECSPESVIAAVLKAATYGMLPGRDCHFLVFANSRKGGKKEATFVPNYAGLILALERTGKIRKAFAEPVYERDVFELDYLSDTYSHKPYVKGPGGELLCFYGCVQLKDGTRHVQHMTLAQVDAIRLRAPGHDTGPWKTDYEEMAKKTALKRVVKYVRLSPAQVALLADDEQREQQEAHEAHFRTVTSDLYGDERPVIAQVVGAGVPARVVPDLSQTPGEGAPELPSGGQAIAWRQKLTLAQQAVQDEELLEDIWAALDDAQTPDAIGQAILARALAQVNAPVAAEEEGT